ncbi:ABC transporter permease [Paraliobacillus sediminis]|uniref:ABC transporter permease n=1 Tax=Paraliobacillus sediminis TaxID=1885916 RepID=UPI000E3BAE2B|nr:DUF2705 family protein [Paraliobacillus sediminis]
MVNLVVNEWVKIIRKKSTLIMIGCMILFVIGFAGILKYTETANEQAHDTNWKQAVETQISSDQAALGANANARMDMFYERNIAINEYRIENNIPPNQETHLWTFVDEAKTIISFAGLFTIIIAAGMVANEFSSGTIKLLLIRPISRMKILLSKYITVILFGLMMIGIIYLTSSLVGMLFFGFPMTDIAHLAYQNGEVIEKNIALHLISQYLLYSIDLLMITTMAFMISAVFRSNSFAIGISLFLFFIGGNATMLLATKFEWAKYILFANTNLSIYFDGTPPIESMTLPFSIIMLLIYFVIFQILAFTIFQKRDVTA